MGAQGKMYFGLDTSASVSAGTLMLAGREGDKGGNEGLLGS
jgi:hypothetical protein